MRRGALIVCAILVLLGVGLYFFYSPVSNWQYSYAPATTAEVDTIAKRVSELVAVPSDEAPTVITVANPQELQRWPLFRDSQRGDKVLVYKKNGRIIIYNPTKDKIVAAGVVVSE